MSDDLDRWLAERHVFFRSGRGGSNSRVPRNAGVVVRLSLSHRLRNKGPPTLRRTGGHPQ